MTLARSATIAIGALCATSLLAACGSDGTSPAPAKSEAARAAAATGYADWTTYHGNNYRTGYAPTMTHVAGQPRVTHRIALDGEVYGSPIVIKGVTVVATENDTVYAFDSSFRQLWKSHLGTPSPANQRPCGNIDPLGITGTPAYSAGTGYVYVAPEFSGNGPTHQLYALSLKTGRTAFHKSLDLPGVDRTVMQQRGALSVFGSKVYVPFGGLAGDCGNYKGRVVSIDKTTGGGATAQFTVPTSREAGIWTPPGASIDLGGNIFVAVGNGASGQGDKYDYSDSVLKLNTKLQRADSFSPSTWPTDNDADLDLGSQGPAIVGPWIFSAGKSGTAYVLRRTHLGGIGGQVSKATICKSFGGTAVVASSVYVPCTDGVRRVDIDKVGRMRVVWHAASGTTGAPVIGGGRVWSLDTGAGVLHALSAINGGSQESIAVGAVTRFATPALYGRNVIVPTTTGITVVTTS